MPLEDDKIKDDGKEKIIENKNDIPPEKKEFKSEAFVNKVLEEKKNTVLKNRELMDENLALKARLKDEEEKKLLEKEDFKKWGEKKEIEANEWKQKYEDSQTTIEKSIKKGAVKNELVKLGIDQKYINDTIKLVNIDNIQYDNDSKTVVGAEDEAKALAEKFPPLFGTNKAGVNHDAPQGDSFRPITLEEWKKLPYEEAKKRKPDLYKNLGINTR